MAILQDKELPFGNCNPISKVSYQTKADMNEVEIELTSCYVSFSAMATTSSLEEEGELLLVQNVIEYLKSESDEQNVYRAIVAIGTLVRQRF
jgi:PUL domain